jgi:hypothetical protein
VSEAKFAELRKPFPDGVVGALPKPYKKESPKGNCQVCGGYHGLPAAHLDFVGHAAVTDRLLSVDPTWTWEPMGFDAQGLPALDREGNLWIRLTVCGVTRIGVGDGASMKEKIGDALRNAAMRFGVALALWTKDELESGVHETKAVEGHPDQQQQAPRPSYTFRQAKNRIFRAFIESGLDKDASKAATESAWLLGETNISEEELDKLIAGLDLSAGAPFEEAS